MSPSPRLALRRCSGSGSPRVFARTNFTPTPCRSPAFPCWRPSPARSTTTISLFFGGASRRSALGNSSTPIRARLALLALLGLVAASWAKLTGFLLTGPMASAVIAYLMWRGRLAVAVDCRGARVLRAGRHTIFVFMFKLWQPDAGDAGADRAASRRRARRRLGRSAAQIFSRLSRLFRRRLRRRLDAGARRPQRLQLCHAGDSRGGARLCALGIALSLRRLWRRQETALDVVVIAGSWRSPSTFAIHVTYQLRSPSRDRLADGRLSALLPAARRDRAAGRPVARSPRSKRRAGATRCWRFLVAGPVDLPRLRCAARLMKL